MRMRMKMKKIAYLFVVLISLLLFVLPHSVQCDVGVDDKTKSIDDEKEKINAFMLWLKNNGAYCSPKIQIKRIKGYGRGIIANKEIESGEKLIEVPYSISLTHKTSIESEIKNALSSLQLSLTNEQAVHLVYEKHKPNSFWKPYIDLLPKIFNTSLYFRPEEIDELQVSPLRAFTTKRLRSVEHNYNETFSKAFKWWPEFFNEKTHTLDSFKWALSSIWSRAFSLSSENGGLVPLADMFNAVQDLKKSKVRVQATHDTLTYFANANIKKGKQIFTPYGSRKTLTNAQLLMDYGFVIEDQEVKSGAQVLLDPLDAKKDKLFEERKTLLTRYELGDNEFQIEHIRLSSQFLATLRTIYATKEEIEQTEAEQNKGLYAPISDRNEKIVEKMVVEILRKQLKKYATTIEEDELLLGIKSQLSNGECDGEECKPDEQETDKKTPVLQGNLRNIIIVRLEEKKVLQKWIDTYEEKIKNRENVQNEQNEQSEQ